MGKYVDRGRDVLYLMEKEGERGVRKAIIKIAESQVHLQQELDALRTIVGNCIDLVGTIQSVAIQQHNALHALNQKFRPNNEANPDQKWSEGNG